MEEYMTPLEVLDSFSTKKIVDKSEFKVLTVDETFKKLSEALTTINDQKICSFIADHKLTPFIVHKGILDEYYYEGEAVEGMNSLEPLILISKVFEGWLTPKDTNLVARLIYKQEPENVLKFIISAEIEGYLYLEETTDEHYTDCYFHHKDRVEYDSRITFSHVQPRGVTSYGYFDLKDGIELRADNFVFSEQQVLRLCKEQEPIKVTALKKSRNDEIALIMMNLIKEHPNASPSKLWLELVNLAKNKKEGLDSYDELNEKVVWNAGLQSDASLKTLNKSNFTARLKRLKK